MLWLRGRHPNEPPTWRADVRDAQARAAQWAAGTLTPDDKPNFIDLWTDHKVTFSRVQKMKCAYCELSIEADANGGDIDHYRPKAEVTALTDDRATWGEEIEGHNSRDPERPRSVTKVGRGYFWLAYEWRNYLLSCGTCNRKWKLNLFPIEGSHAGPPTEQSWLTERPLLLNPYDDIDPAKHLEFDKIGQIAPRNDSAPGLETIRTCHLWRESLRNKREPIAKQAWPFITSVIRELDREEWDRKRLRNALVRLLNLGLRKKPHAGMVRILWAQQGRFGFKWSTLRKLAASLRRA